MGFIGPLISGGLGIGKLIADLFKGGSEESALQGQIGINNETIRRNQALRDQFLQMMGGPEALLGAVPTTTSQRTGTQDSATTSAFNEAIKRLSPKDLQTALAARRSAVADAASEGRGRTFRDLRQLAEQERALSGSIPAGTTGPAGRANTRQSIRESMISPRLNILGSAEERMKADKESALGALENLAGLQTGRSGTSTSQTAGTTTSAGTSAINDPISRFANLYGVMQDRPLESTITGRNPWAEAISSGAGAAMQLPWGSIFRGGRTPSSGRRYSIPPQIDPSNLDLGL
jgi:hypothetical protein